MAPRSIYVINFPVGRCRVFRYGASSFSLPTSPSVGHPELNHVFTGLRNAKRKHANTRNVLKSYITTFLDQLSSTWTHKMNMDWHDSINPFFTTSSGSSSYGNGNSSRSGGSSDRIMENPLKIDTNSSFFPSSIFKPIPLPDDILGFDPLPQSQVHDVQQRQVPPLPPAEGFNASFDLEKYLKSDLDEELDAENLDNDFLDANLQFNMNFPNMDSKETDIEKVLLDLGISEVPKQNVSPEQPPVTETPHAPGHKRKISGSGIFGFVGVGENTQLSIPGIEPVTFINKKPQYKDVTNFDNLGPSYINGNRNSTATDAATISKDNYAKVNSSSANLDNFIPNVSLTNLQAPITPVKQVQNREKPEYYVSSGNPVSYKFPPSPPKGTFEPTENANREYPPNKSYSAQELQNLRQLSKSKSQQQMRQPTIVSTNHHHPKSPLPTPLPTSPLNSVAMSSPLKEMFQTPKTGSPKKVLPLSQLQAQSQFQVRLNKQLRDPDDTSIIDDDKDKTISAMNTPLKLKLSAEMLQTPTKSKFTNLGWDPTMGPKKPHMFTQRILKSPKRSPIRKKPTITSTLATGTLDKYFEGPTAEGKFVCRFFDQEIQGVCNREFGRISNARAHIQTHLSDRPFVCEECGKAFVRNHDLRRHQKGHSVASNICPCGKRFPRSDALKRHRFRNICVGGIPRNNGVFKPCTHGHSHSHASDKMTTMAQINSKNKNNQKITEKLLGDINKEGQPIIRETIFTSQQEQPLSQTSKFSHLSQPVSLHQSQYTDRPLLPNQSLFNTSSSKDIDLFDFNEIASVDGNFSFNMDDSLVI